MMIRWSCAQTQVSEQACSQIHVLAPVYFLRLLLYVSKLSFKIHPLKCQAKTISLRLMCPFLICFLLIVLLLEALATTLLLTRCDPVSPPTVHNYFFWQHGHHFLHIVWTCPFQVHTFAVFRNYCICHSVHSHFFYSFSMFCCSHNWLPTLPRCV